MAILLSGIEPTSTHLSGNPIEVKATTSGIPEGASEYMILLKIDSSTLIGSPFIDAIEPDENGEAWFDISGYVDQGIEKNLTWPVRGQYEGRIIGHDEGSYTVRLFAGERYIDVNGNLVESFPHTPTIEPIFIVAGKIPYWKLAELNEVGKTWWEKYCRDGEFFTYMPQNQRVTPFQPLKLWWIPPVTDIPVVIKISSVIMGSTNVLEIYNGNLYYNYLWEIELSPYLSLIPLYDQSGNRLEKFDVWIESEGEIICGKRTFEVIWDQAYYKIWYLFIDNGMGGVECLSLTGRAIYEPSGDHNLVSFPFARNGGIKTSAIRVISSTRTRRWKINSGIKPKSELEAMDFLLDTKHAWLAIPPPDGSTDIYKYKLAPVIISNSEFSLNDDTKEIESIDIELTEAR